MSPDTLCEIGELLFGPAWVSALAAALGVTVPFVSRMKAGKKPVPADWPDRLLAIALARHGDTGKAVVKARQAVAALRRAA